MDNPENDTDFTSMLKKLATSSLSFVWNRVRKTPYTILELDSTMTDLQLTTNSTATELEVSYKRSNEVARSPGISASAVTQAITDWMRLGYSVKEAQFLAKTPSIFSSISPGMDTSNAIKTIVNTMKAYGIETDSTSDGVASKTNVVDEPLSISSQDIFEILNTSATVMKAFNIGLGETIAFGITAQATIHDTVEVGNAFNTVSPRIQGFGGETSNLSVSLAQLNRDTYNLTNHQVNTQSDDSTYKDTYTILDETNRVWGNLIDSQCFGILPEPFSLEQASAGPAIIINFDKTRQATDLMRNSAGNVMVEMSAVYDRVEYKLDQLSQVSIGIVQNLFLQDGVGNTVNIPISLASVFGFTTEKTGLSSTALGDVGLTAFVKNFA